MALIWGFPKIRGTLLRDLYWGRYFLFPEGECKSGQLVISGESSGRDMEKDMESVKIEGLSCVDCRSLNQFPMKPPDHPHVSPV